MVNYTSPIAILFVGVSTTINNVDAKSLLRKRHPNLGMQQQQQQAKSRQLEVAELSGCVGGCSISMSLLEQSSQFTPELTIVGDEGLPEGTFPLGQCQGDCDDDSECADGLACFQRDDYEMVPGCSGKGERKTDYCYDPTLAE